MAIRTDEASTSSVHTGVDESLRGLGTDVADHVKRLIQLEIELAKAQAKASAKSVAIGVGLVVVGLLFLLYAIAYFLAPIATHFGLWAGWLIEGVVFLVVFAVLALLGYRLIKRGIKGGVVTAGEVKGNLTGTVESVKGRNWRG
ncbi:MAG: phage holin family protein [Candidatus Dormibacteria bacterium]